MPHVERLVAGLVTGLVGGGLGVLLSRFVWAFAEPKPTCKLGPGGHCPGPDAFLPYALVGGGVGAVVTLLALIAFVRTLDN